eukprot:359667-Chlamydomonas_euryale.AAC.5
MQGTTLVRGPGWSPHDHPFPSVRPPKAPAGPQRCSTASRKPETAHGRRRAAPSASPLPNSLAFPKKNAHSSTHAKARTSASPPSRRVTLAPLPLPCTPVKGAKQHTRKTRTG